MARPSRFDAFSKKIKEADTVEKLDKIILEVEQSPLSENKIEELIVEANIAANDIEQAGPKEEVIVQNEDGEDVAVSLPESVSNGKKEEEEIVKAVKRNKPKDIGNGLKSVRYTSLEELKEYESEGILWGNTPETKTSGVAVIKGA